MPRKPAQPRRDEPIRLVHLDSGQFRYRITLDTARAGEPRRQITRTRKTLTEARTLGDDTRASLASRTYSQPNAVTVADLCDDWLKSRDDIRAVTVDGYQAALAPVLRRIGHRKVQDVTAAEVRQTKDWLLREGGSRGQALSPRSVKAALVALSQALDMAVTDGVVAHNVSKSVRAPRARAAVGDDVQHWSAAELLRFRAHADTDVWAGAWRLTLAGMTRADVLGLRWSDVDLDRGVVTISQGRVALTHGDHTDDPKSQARRRSLNVEDVHPGTLPLLRMLKSQQAADRLAVGPAWQDSGLVVVNAVGVPVRPENYSDRFRRLSRAADVPVIRLHSVRHSLAKMLHHGGVSPADAAAMLGHTVDVYLRTYLPASGSSGVSTAARNLGATLAAQG